MRQLLFTLLLSSAGIAFGDKYAAPYEFGARPVTTEARVEYRILTDYYRMPRDWTNDEDDILSGFESPYYYWITDTHHDAFKIVYERAMSYGANITLRRGPDLGSLCVAIKSEYDRCVDELIAQKRPVLSQSSIPSMLRQPSVLQILSWAVHCECHTVKDSFAEIDRSCALKATAGTRHGWVCRDPRAYSVLEIKPKS